MPKNCYLTTGNLPTSSDARGKIITVVVGPERRCFQVHLQSLGPVLAKLVDEPTQTVELPDDDPQAFNLFVSWRYNRDLLLPRVPDLSRYVPKPHPAPKDLFGAAANGGTAAKDQAQAQAPPQAQAQAQAQAAPSSGNGLPADLLFKRYTPYREAQSFISYNHICFQDPMSKYSPEELRLQFQQARLSDATTKAAPATEAPDTFCNGALDPVTLAPTTAPSLAPASTTVPFGLPVAAQPAKAAVVQPTEVAAQPKKTAVQPANVAAQPAKEATQPLKAVAAHPTKAAAQPTELAAAVAAAAPQLGKPVFPGVTVSLGKRQKTASEDAGAEASRVPGAFPSANGTPASGSIFSVGSWFPLGSTSKASGSADSVPAPALEHDGDGSNSDSKAGDAKPETLQSLMASADADAEPAEEEEYVAKGNGRKEEDEKGQVDKGQNAKGKGRERDDKIKGEEEKKEAPPATNSKSEVDAGKGKGKGKDVEDLEELAIPPWIPAPVARQAAALQDTLLNLVLLADKYKLWAVFNAALEAFRAGERQLARPFPPMRHVLLCHQHANLPCWEERRPGPFDPFPYPFFSPLASRFMYDYAYVLAVRNKLMRKYAVLFTRDPRFAAEMLTRLDGFLEVPGFQERGGARVAGGKGPLDEAVMAYRYPVKHDCVYVKAKPGVAHR